MMRQDIFIEKIVRRKKTIKDMFLSALIISLIPIIAFGTLLLGPELGSALGLPLIAGACYLAYRLISGMNTEFEYIATNEDLTIDKIIARRKRKRLFNGSCRSFTILAPVSDRSFQTSKTDRVKLLDYSSGVDNPNRWFLVTNKDSQQVMIIFEPDDRFLESFKRYNPRALTQAGITT